MKQNEKFRSSSLSCSVKKLSNLEKIFETPIPAEEVF